MFGQFSLLLLLVAPRVSSLLLSSGLFTPPIPTNTAHHGLSSFLKETYPGTTFDPTLHTFIASLPDPLKNPSPSTYGTYSLLCPLTILARSSLSPSFAFYSPSTGLLTASGYATLQSRMTRALPDLSRWKRGREIDCDGWQGQEVRYKGVVEDTLRLGDDEGEVEMGKTVRTEWELDLVRFDAAGRICSIISGVTLSDPVLDGSSSGRISNDVTLSPSAKVEIDELKARIAGMYDKLETLRGQESSMGFMKQKQDIDDLELDLRVLTDKSLDGSSNVGGRGGLTGLHSRFTGKKLRGLASWQLWRKNPR